MQTRSKMGIMFEDAGVTLVYTMAGEVIDLPCRVGVWVITITCDHTHASFHGKSLAQEPKNSLVTHACTQDAPV